jgi:hypothetical protein
MKLILVFLILAQLFFVWGNDDPSNYYQNATIDLAFLLDATGSMNRHINDTKHVVRRLVTRARMRALKIDVKTMRLGLVAYRDFQDGERHFETLQFTEEETKFNRFLENLEARGGGKAAEDIFGGIEKATNELNWKTSSKARLLFMIAHTPCHGRKFHNTWSLSDEYPNGDPKNRKLSKLMNDLASEGIRLRIGNISTLTDTMIPMFKREYEKQAKRTEYCKQCKLTVHQLKGKKGEKGEESQRRLESVLEKVIVDALRKTTTLTPIRTRRTTPPCFFCQTENEDDFF